MENAQAMPDSAIASTEDSLGVTSMRSTDSGGYSDQGPSIVQNDSGSHSVGALSAAQLSPQRSTHNMTSVTNSPASAKVTTPLDTTPQNLSPIRNIQATTAGPVQVDASRANFLVPSLEYSNALLLGVQQLERQQAEHEHRRLYSSTPQLQNQRPQPYVSSQNSASAGDDDDEDTEPSSSMTGTTGENPSSINPSDQDATSTFGRLIQNTRRRLSSGDRNRAGSADEENMLEGVLIYGYLQKLGRNGKWQTRWFETDGECLTYYKSSKRVKLLATLDLAKVGSIVINHSDPKGCSFTINISERPYHLRADSKAACRDWVIILNRVKEARMQEGNVKLVMPTPSLPPDLLDQHNPTPRVVVVANRQRTRAVDEEALQSWETVVWEDNPAVSQPNSFYGEVAPPSSNRLARWQKSRNSISRIANKVLRWARSLRKYGCTDAENHVVLDHHVHPPGHDDKPKRTIASASPRDGGSPPESGHEVWIGKETAASDRGGPAPSSQELHTLNAESLAQPVSAAESNDDEELETRELS